MALKENTLKLVEKASEGKCPLRVPAQHVKKSVFTIYMTIMLDVFSHSSWNGW